MRKKIKIKLNITEMMSEIFVISINKQRLLSLGITFLLSCILMITILLIMFSKTVVNYLISAEIIEKLCDIFSSPDNKPFLLSDKVKI